uniref:Shootin-1 n=3 Tax=Bursaphelenchus xylophilus TaxID=6326 RepID=A0A1I7SND8_BURXY
NELCTKKNDLEEQLTAKKEARERKSANYEKLLSELESSVKKAEAQLRLNEDLEQRLQLEYESKEVIVKGKEKELTVCRNFFRKIGEKRFKERPEDQSQVQSAFNMAIQ